MREESWRMNHEVQFMAEESWRGNHEKQSWGRNHGGGIIEEES